MKLVSAIRKSWSRMSALARETKASKTAMKTQRNCKERVVKISTRSVLADIHLFKGVRRGDSCWEPIHSIKLKKIAYHFRSTLIWWTCKHAGPSCSVCGFTCKICPARARKRMEYLNLTVVQMRNAPKCKASIVLFEYICSFVQIHI